MATHTLVTRWLGDAPRQQRIDGGERNGAGDQMAPEELVQNLLLDIPADNDDLDHRRQGDPVNTASGILNHTIIIALLRSHVPANKLPSGNSTEGK